MGEYQIEDLYDQYQTLKETLTMIKGGATYVSLSHPRGHIRVSALSPNPDAYLSRLKGDIMMSLREVRQGLIDALEAEGQMELGYSDVGSDQDIDPNPVGTLKNDYRRHASDSDDGK